jgi:hypothetical protein
MIAARDGAHVALTGVAARELDAVTGDRVDVRRRYGAVGDAAAGEGEVVVAEVVGDDHDDVGRTIGRRPRRIFRARLPRDLGRGADRVPPAIEHPGQREEQGLAPCPHDGAGDRDESEEAQESRTPGHRRTTTK